MRYPISSHYLGLSAAVRTPCLSCSAGTDDGSTVKVPTGPPSGNGSGGTAGRGWLRTQAGARTRPKAQVVREIG